MPGASILSRLCAFRGMSACPDSPLFHATGHPGMTRHPVMACHPCMTYHHCMTCHPAMACRHPMKRAHRTTWHPAMRRVVHAHQAMHHTSSTDGLPRNHNIPCIHHVSRTAHMPWTHPAVPAERMTLSYDTPSTDHKTSTYHMAFTIITPRSLGTCRSMITRHQRTTCHGEHGRYRDMSVSYTHLTLPTKA